MNPKRLVTLCVGLTVLLSAAAAVSAQEQREPTGEMRDDANQTILDPTPGEREDRRDNASDIQIRSPLDPEFGERGNGGGEDDTAANETEPRGTPAVAVPVVLAALAAVLVWARRRA